MARSSVVHELVRQVAAARVPDRGIGGGLAERRGAGRKRVPAGQHLVERDAEPVHVAVRQVSERSAARRGSVSGGAYLAVPPARDRLDSAARPR